MNNFSFKNLRIDGLAVAVPNDAEQVMDYENIILMVRLKNFVFQQVFIKDMWDIEKNNSIRFMCNSS